MKENKIIALNFLRKIFCIYLITSLTSSCLRKTPNLNLDICRNLTYPCIQEKEILSFKTSKGDFIVEIDAESAPLTSSNFLDLVKKGFYNNMTFHRVIDKPNPFIIQSGDPASKDKQIPINKLGLGNYIEPNTGRTRFIPLEIKLEKEKNPRYNELITDPVNLNKIKLRHLKGSIAMARRQSVNSASSQFYIVLNEIAVLDGRYAVFGKVIKGLEIISLIKQGDLIKEIKHISKIN